MFQKLESLTLIVTVMVVTSFLPAVAATTTISKCGTITRPGTYDIFPHATLHSNGDCLVVKAPNVIVQTMVATITGNGTGAGIHILASAVNFQFFGFAGVINNFNVGILDEANNAAINNDYGAPMWIGDQVSTGILLNGVVGSQVNGAGVHALFNGVFIHGGHNNLITGYETQIEVGGTGGSSECCFEAISSDSDAIRVDNGSYGNVIFQALVVKGGSDGAGIHVTGNSRLNFVGRSQVNGAGTGIRVEKDAGYNTVVKNSVTGNTLDLFEGNPPDGNPPCDGDFWTANVFGTSNSSCIQ